MLFALPEGKFVLKLYFLRKQNEGDCGIEDKFDPVCAERKIGRASLKSLRIQRRAHLPVSIASTIITFILTALRHPDPANLAPLRDGIFNCVAQQGL